MPPVGARGYLVATVLETRQSDHIGDSFRGLSPSTPRIGEEITLGGPGELFIEMDFAPVVGLRPDNDRETDWLNPKSLYRCHNQTVRLEFRD